MSEAARGIENPFDTDVAPGAIATAMPRAARPGGLTRTFSTVDDASGYGAGRRLWAGRHSLDGGGAEQGRTGITSG